MATKTEKQRPDIGEVLDAALDAAEAKLRALLPAHAADAIAAEFAGHVETHLREELENIACHGDKNDHDNCDGSR